MFVKENPDRKKNQSHRQIIAETVNLGRVSLVFQDKAGLIQIPLGQ